MIRFTALLLAFSLIFVHTVGLGASKIKVVTTTTDLKVLTEAVGGEKVEVESIARGYQNPHFVEAKPSHMIKLRSADMFVKVGLDLELWAQVLTEGSRNRNIYPGGNGYIDASIGVELLEIPPGQIDRSLGDIHIFGNPHYWLDPMNGIAIMENVLRGLTNIAPQDAKYFIENKEEYGKRLREATAKWIKQMEPYRDTKIVTYHNSWPNFANRFGLKVVGFIEPKPGIPASPAHIASLISLMQREKVKVIIMEPYFSDQAPQLVAGKTDAQVLVLPPSVGGVEGLNSYIELFEYNISKLIETFEGKRGGTE
jgi:zinc/manganese transport system substrate-binding protein